LIKPIHTLESLRGESFLDKETRGIIEQSFDFVLEQDILEVVNWILEEFSIKSPQDLALGYVLGSLMRYSYEIVREEKRWKMIKKESEKRLVKKIGKKSTKEFMERLEKKEENVRPIRVSLTEKETNQLRSMLKQRIPYYKRRIYRELNR